MILGKLWRTLRAWLNKWMTKIHQADPIALMQYECDQAVERMKEGRQGLEQYRGLVERVARQVGQNHKQALDLEAKIKSYLQAGDRTLAAQFAIELDRVEKQLQDNQEQLKLHEEAYHNNLVKLKHANNKIVAIRHKISTYDAHLRMGKAEAEIAKLAHAFDFNVTTNFGEMEQLIQDKIDRSRAEVRVAADLSSQGLDEIKHEQEIEKHRAEQVLLRFEQKNSHKEDAYTLVRRTDPSNPQ